MYVVKRRGRRFLPTGSLHCNFHSLSSLYEEKSSTIAAMQSSTVAAQMEREVKLGALQEASKLIHLLYHRNKNQHHHALWWKWLSMLQRSVAKLTRALEEKRCEQATTRMKHMRDVLLPGCYL